MNQSWNDELEPGTATRPSYAEPVRSKTEVGTEQAEALEKADWAGGAGEEDVGRGLVALGLEGQGQVVGGAVPDLDDDAGLGGEGFEDGAHEFLGAARVDGEGLFAVTATGGGCEGEEEDGAEAAGRGGAEAHGRIGP